MGEFRLRVIELFLFIFSFASSPLFPNVSWGSQDSTIKVLPGARFNVGSSNLVVEGTLSQDTGATISGNSFSFDKGVLEQEDVEIFATGIYDPSETNVLNLVGDSLFRFEPGSIVYGVQASGTGNVISGQPLFENPVIFTDSSTEVSVGIQNALSKNIVLNGGKLICIDDLALADNVKIIGPGSMDLNSRQFTLGGYYSTPWSQALTFFGATSVYLTGNTQLSGTWAFSGISRMNGNGVILDLASTGQIVLLPGAKLYLEDIEIKGLSDLAGKIVFSDATCELHLSNVRLGLVGDYSMSTGQIFVNATSTFVLRNFIWTINSPAKLTVNADVLWLEVLSREVYPDTGSLNAPLAIYDDNGYNAANVANNISGGTLALLNDGTIKETIASTVAPVPPIFSGDVYYDVTLNQTYILQTDQVVNITGDVTINGGGQSLVFTCPENPQFIVEPGYTVVLQNITLANICANTFLIGEGAQVIIGENVTFTFIEDVTLTGPFVVLDGVEFTLIGEGAQRVVTFSNDDAGIAALDLGNSTLILENIELNGISDISYGPSNLIQLAGEGEVDIDINNGLNFLVDGPENYLTLLDDDLTLSGLISWGGQAVNELFLRFVLTYGLRPGAIHPKVNFSGGPGISLGGDAKEVCRLIIENPYVIFGLLNNNAFLIDAGGQLFYHELELVPSGTALIKQYSSNILISGIRLIGQVSPEFGRLHGQAVHQRPSAGYSTGGAKAEKRDKKRIEPKSEAVKESKNTGKTKNKQDKVQDKTKDNKNKYRHNRKAAPHIRMVEGFEGALNDGANDFTTLRAVDLPPLPYDLVYEDAQIKQNLPPVGNILVSTSSRMYNIETETKGVYSVFNIVLKDNSTLAFADKDIILDPANQKINVVGVGNVIEVHGSLRINNNLLLDEGAELTIRFVKTGSETPYVIFDEDNTIDVEYSGVLRFEGPGLVEFSNGMTVNLNGEKIIDSHTGKIIKIQRAQLIIHDGAVLTLTPEAQARISGVGALSVQDGGYINLTSPGTLFIGDDQKDDIDVEVFGASEVKLNNRSEISGLARISMEYLTSNLKFENGGVLSIAKDGSFEVNCSDSALRRGHIKQISFDGHGGLYIKENGVLKLAPNRVDPKTGYGYELDWLGSELTLGGDGSVQFTNYKTAGSFVSKFAPSNSKIKYDYYGQTALTFEQIATMLANK
jgi:hypothetical protein